MDEGLVKQDKNIILSDSLNKKWLLNWICNEKIVLIIIKNGKLRKLRSTKRNH